MYCHREICVVNDKSRSTAGRFLDILLLEIVDLDLVGFATLGVVACEHRSLLIYTIRHFFPLVLYNNVRSWHAFCVKPPVVSGCKFEGKLIVLVVVFADIHIVTIGRNIVERFAFHFLLLACSMFLDKPVFRQFLLDLDKIIGGERDI